MRKSDLSKYFSKLGKKGGKARLTEMTKEQRRQVASAGGKASAEAKAKKKGKQVAK
jgi:hypothetical protein